MISSSYGYTKVFMKHAFIIGIQMMVLRFINLYVCRQYVYRSKNMFRFKS